MLHDFILINVYLFTFLTGIGPKLGGVQGQGAADKSGREDARPGLGHPGPDGWACGTSSETQPSGGCFRLVYLWELQVHANGS